MYRLGDLMVLLDVRRVDLFLLTVCGGVLPGVMEVVAGCHSEDCLLGSSFWRDSSCWITSWSIVSSGRIASWILWAISS